MGQEETSKPGWRQAVPGSVVVPRYDHTAPEAMIAGLAVVVVLTAPGAEALPELSIAVTV